MSSLVEVRDADLKSGPAIAEPHASRGVAFGDLDNDGRTDIILNPMNEPAVLLRNRHDTGHHWLGIELVGAPTADGKGKQRDVVGARISLKIGDRTQWRFTKGGGSYLSARDPRQVFGLGKQNKVGRLTVTWPNGQQQHWDQLATDHYYRLTQGKEQAEQRPGSQ